METIEQQEVLPGLMVRMSLDDAGVPLVEVARGDNIERREFPRNLNAARAYVRGVIARAKANAERPAALPVDVREAWLQAAAVRTGALITAATKLTPPAMLVSVGFPRGAAGRRKAIGQCHSQKLSADGKTPHVFICPTQADPVRVLDILLHEQIHATLGTDCGHKAAFGKAAAAVGLCKPWTATTAGPELALRLNDIARDLGPYPHVALREAPRGHKGSRLRLWECGCGVKVRVASDDFQATCKACASDFEMQ